MKKTKRILAGLAALLLVSMYIAALVFALIDHPASQNLLMASLFCTMVIPVLIYGYLLVYKLTHKSDETN